MNRPKTATRGRFDIRPLLMRHQARQCALNFSPSKSIGLTKDDIIEELRLRLRRSQGARFKAEAHLAIVTVERDRLAEKLKALGI